MRAPALALVVSTVVSIGATQSPAIAADAIGVITAAIGTPTASGPGGDRKLAAGAPVYEPSGLAMPRSRLMMAPASWSGPGQRWWWTGF